MDREHPTTIEHTKSLFDKADKVLNDLAYIAPEAENMQRTKVVNQLLLATKPLYDIHELMSGKEWSPDTLDQIAAVLRNAGFVIEEP